MVKELVLTWKDAARLRGKWPQAAGSVGEVRIDNVLQSLKPAERVHVMNELHRVLAKGGKATVVTPHWCSSRSLGDLSVQWPPVAEAWYFNLNADWRKQNPPRGFKYACDFDIGIGYGLHQALLSRNFEYQQNAIMFWKEAAQDLVVTLTKR